MTATRCARGWERDAVRDGRLGAADAASYWRHVRTCADCAADVARDERLRALGCAWQAGDPGELAVRRLRVRVLRDAANAPTASPLPVRRLAVGLVLAAALLGPWVAMSRQKGRDHLAAPAAVAAPQAAPGPFAGSITASSDARWIQSRNDDVERVRLEAGTITVHVRRQLPGERFVVELPDGELEVRGTTFEVSSVGGATTLVHVDEGTVELRLRGEPTHLLGAGDGWPPPPRAKPATPDTERSAPPRAAPSPVAASTSAPAIQGAAATDPYADAMALLRAGRAEDAAAAFHAFASVHPYAPQAEDASFLEALALARAGRRDAAGLAAERHLASYPGSFHRKEAAILVARAADLRGDCPRARTVLAPWLGAAPDPDAVAALRGCSIVP